MTTPRRGGQLTSGRDPHTPEQRRLNMSRIRGKDTKPELLVRRTLHAAGLRYRLHVRDLPGRPDLVFPGPRGVIFVHGCFWHGHDCPLFRLPATRPEFWAAKVAVNTARDIATVVRLVEADWRVMTVWECALRGRARWPLEMLTPQITSWLNGTEPTAEISGDWDRLDRTI